VLDLTVEQLNYRIMDIGHINEMQYDKGKGRLSIDPEKLKKRMGRIGMKPPKTINLGGGATISL